MAQLATWLISIDPKLWYIGVAGVLWLVTYVWRRFLPSVWAAAISKSPALPQLWMTVLGALMNAAPAIGKPLGAFVEQLLVGAVLAVIGAQGIHDTFRALPGPYNGAQKQVAAAFVKRNTPPSGVPTIDPPVKT